jgi:hypothetical protein
VTDIRFNPPDPFDLNVSFSLGLNTAVDTAYRQVGEDDYSTGPVTVLDLIVAQASRDIAKQFMGGRYDDPIKTRMNDAIDAEVRAVVGPMVAKALDAEWTPTDEWGDAIGESTTLRKMVRAQAEKALEVKPPDRNGYNAKGSPLYEALAEVTAATVRKELAAELAEARKSVAAKVGNVTAEVLADTIVRSLTT